MEYLPKRVDRSAGYLCNKKYLSNTEMRVKEIASLLNFEDVPYMCRFFLKQTGLSPIEYREGYR